MHRLVEHVRGNVIGYLALFCALGGTGYAASSLPRGSVGTQQLRNGSVTPAKLAAGQSGGYVRAWAGIGAGGRVEVSGGKVRVGQAGPGAWVIFWPGQDNRCRVIGSVDAHQEVQETPGFVLSGAPFRGRAVVQIYNAQGQPADLPFDVELLCPTP